MMIVFCGKILAYEGAFLFLGRFPFDEEENLLNRKSRLLTKHSGQYRSLLKVIKEFIQFCIDVLC